MLKRIIGKIINKILRPEHSWREIEYFSETWKKRISVMSSYLTPSDDSVMDLWCGRGWLREFIGERQYIWVDYVARDASTIVCDFNAWEFPDKEVDVVFISGCLEYIEEPMQFLQKVAKTADKVIISYCSLEENPKIKVRRNIGWKNDLTKLDLVKMFNDLGYKLREYSYAIERNNIFVFEK